MRTFSLVLAVVATTALATQADASGWSIGEQSIVAGGTAGAGVARTGDPGAAWYNPAALADGKGLRIGVGMMFAMPRISATSVDGSWSAETEAGVSTPPHIYGSYAFGRWAVGMAFNVPFGSGVTWGDSWEGKYEAVSSSVQVFRLAPFAAARLGPVRIAVGPHLDIAKLSFSRQVDFHDAEAFAKVSLSGVGAGAHAAVYYEPLPFLSFGLSYKSRVNISLSGTADFQDVPVEFSAKALDQNTTSAISLPDLLTFGVAVQPHERLKINVDVGVAFWSIYEKLDVEFAEEATTDIHRNVQWQTRPFVRGGAEFEAIQKRLIVRLGMLYDPTPAPARTLAPNSPDSSRLGVTAGLGVHIWRGLSVDAFYAYLHMLGQQSERLDTGDLNAQYGGQVHMVGVGLRYGAI